MPMFECKVDPSDVAIDDEFTVALAPPELTRRGPAGVEFAIAIDASPSMNWSATGDDRAETTRWDLARHGAAALLDSIADRSRVHLVLFGDDARIAAAGTAAELRRNLPALLPVRPPAAYRGTNIEAGLNTCYRVLNRSTATSRTVILLSDGAPTMGRLAPEDLAGLAGGAARRDIYTRPIALGAGADIDMLMGISSNGHADLVKTSAAAQQSTQALMSELGVLGQTVVASGGDAAIVVSPHFAVLGVYQIFPSRRRLGRATQSMPDGTTRVSLPLGAIGAGDDRPLFALRLRAPSRSSSAPLPLLRATGSIRTARGRIGVDETEVRVRLVVGRTGALDGTTLDLIDGIDLEAEVAGQLAGIAPEDYESVYRAARDRAAGRGLTEVASMYDNLIRSLRAGEEPREVYMQGRSTSSKGATRPRTILLDRPAAAPRPRRRPTSGSGSGSTGPSEPATNPASTPWEGTTGPSGPATNRASTPGSATVPRSASDLTATSFGSGLAASSGGAYGFRGLDEEDEDDDPGQGGPVTRRGRF